MRLPQSSAAGDARRREGAASAASACVDVPPPAGIPPANSAAGASAPAVLFGETPHIVVVLPLPPSANRMWRHARGRTYKSAEYISWLGSVHRCCHVQGAGDTVPRLYALRIVLPKTRMDPDNLIKPTNDALAEAQLIANDRFARRILLEVDEAREPDTMLVELWALPDPPKAPRKRKASA